MFNAFFGFNLQIFWWPRDRVASPWGENPQMTSRRRSNYSNSCDHICQKDVFPANITPEIPSIVHFFVATGDSHNEICPNLFSRETSDPLWRPSIWSQLWTPRRRAQKASMLNEAPGMDRKRSSTRCASGIISVCDFMPSRSRFWSVAPAKCEEQLT